MSTYLRLMACCAMGTALLSGSWAQTDAKTAPPAKSTQITASETATFQMSPIDTANFFPAIDNTYRFVPKQPKNPVQLPELSGIKNKLPVGQQQDFKRIGEGTKFPGIAATGWYPPDCDHAVGPNHIVQVVNSSIAIYQRNGTQDLQQTMSTFYSGMGAGTFLFDPKVIYDRVKQRFVVVCLEQANSPTTSKLLIAVSDDSNPNGTWYRYRVESKLTVSGVEYWLDYPGFGYNKDAWVITGNMFGFSSGFAGVYFVIIPSATPSTGGAMTIKYLRDSTGASAQVAEMISASADRIYAISREGATSMRLYALQSLTAATPTVTFASVTVPSNASPTVDAASTNGRTLDSLDGRLFNVYWRAGRLVTAHNVDNSGAVGSKWYEIATNNYPSASAATLQTGLLGSSHSHMPAVASNLNGDIGVVYTLSSTSITANISGAGRYSSDSPGAISIGYGFYGSIGDNYALGRWGDYFGLETDPNDDITFWATAMRVDAANNWTTEIFSFTVTPPINYLALSKSKIRSGDSFKLTCFLTNYSYKNNMPVYLTSSNPAVVPVPSSFAMPYIQYRAGAGLIANRVEKTTPVTITARFGESSKSITFNVQP